MPNDVKLGLFLGVVVVIIAALLMYPLDRGAPPPAETKAKAIEVATPPTSTAKLSTPAPLSRPKRNIEGQTTSHVQQ